MKFSIYFDLVSRQLYRSIKSNDRTLISYLKEVWRFRHLILTFATRDLKVQYAQTYLGILWSVIQPLTGLVIFTFFFQKVIHLNLTVPYPVFAFSGMMGWFYFTSLMGLSGTSLLQNVALIKKVNFPRLVLPLSKAVVGLVEFSISLLLLFVLILLTGTEVSYRIIFLPLVVFANIITGLSIGIWLSALTIRFRDFHHLIPYLIGFGIWVTPVFYPATIVPENYRWIYYFHPVANLIAMYRWIFIGWPVPIVQTIISLLIVLVIFISGLYFFMKNEKFIADYL